MKTAKVISALGLLAMSIAIVRAFVVGDFGSEGAWLTSHPWGIVSLVDLYVGFVIFSMWIVYRERSWAAAAVWVVLMMILGNWTAALYVLIALYASRGEWRRFWMGHRAS
jgi:hypothetical protein